MSRPVRAWGAGLASLLLAGCGAPAASTAPPPRRAADPRPGAAARDFAAGRWVDLTHSFDAATIYWPTETGFQFEQGDNGPTPKGYYYAANQFTTAEHGGTHLDAPRHFAEGGHTADQVEPERFVGEVVVIDATAKCAADPVYEVTADDLVAWERRHGRQLVDVIVLLRTGWASRWGDREAYLGTAATGPEAVSRLRFPGLAPEAAKWLVEHRRVKAVGIDTASIDHGPSSLFGSHVALCSGNVPIFENVADLSALPAEGAFAAALPMKIAGGSGGPLRILARLPE